LAAEPALPEYPERALTSKAVLYRPLQDIDIFVEDEGSEVFYNALLERLVGDRARISCVIPLRGRLNVLKRAGDYADRRPALFLIDGDLEWVAGLPQPSLPHLFVHPCYCVENYLFCERAMIQISVENGVMAEDDAKAQLRWESLCKRLKDNLVPLFVEFAVAYALRSDIRTVSRGIGAILEGGGGAVPQLDLNKVAALCEQVRTEVLQHVDAADYLHTRTSVEERVQVLNDPLDVVSGKDFLLPLQMFEVNRVGGQKVQRRSFVFRLARHCSLEKLGELRNRILKALEPSLAS